MSFYREFVRKSKEGRVVITKKDGWDYEAEKKGSPCVSMNGTPRETLDDFHKTEKQYLDKDKKEMLFERLVEAIDNFWYGD